jgi:hypothetical protein
MLSTQTYYCCRWPEPSNCGRTAAWFAFRDADPNYFTEVILAAVCSVIAIPLFLPAMIGYSNRKVA